MIARPAPDQPATIHPVWADTLTGKVLGDLLIKDEGGRLTGYMVGQLISDSTRPAAMRGALRNGLQEALPVLGEHLIGPLAATLRDLGTPAVALVPAGVLGNLPLHAAQYTVAGRPCMLLDEFTVVYAPAAQVLAASRAAARPAAPWMGIAGVGNPAVAGAPLPYAQLELARVAALFPATARRTLYGSAASKGALLAALPGMDVIHFACHGSFDLHEPRASGLVLADREWLTLSEIAARREWGTARLVVLSACQSVIADPQRLADEVIGLPAGFLQAGVPTVVGSLWRVDDFSTALLMEAFYQGLFAGQPPAAALRQAQRWLRDLPPAAVVAWVDAAIADLHRIVPHSDRDKLLFNLKAQRQKLETLAEPPFAHPYYWAAFTVWGG